MDSSSVYQLGYQRGEREGPGEGGREALIERKCHVCVGREHGHGIFAISEFFQDLQSGVDCLSEFFLVLLRQTAEFGVHSVS